MSSANHKTSDMVKRALSFKYAFNGIKTAIKTQANMRIHLIAAFLVTAMGFYFKISNAEWILVVMAIGFVISAELFNSALEFLTDLVSPEQNNTAGKVKDIAAGAVLISAISAAIIGLIIFLPRFKDLL